MKDIMQGVLIAGGIKYKSDRQRRKTGQGRGDLLEMGRGDFPSSPVVKDSVISMQGTRVCSIPGRGTKIPQAMQCE